MKKLSILTTLLLCMVTHVWGVTEVTLTLKNIVIEAGSTYQLYDDDIVAKDADGNVVSGLKYTYTSGDANIATVDGNGLITGIKANGATRITVDLSDESSANYKIGGEKRFYVLVCKKDFKTIKDLHDAFKKSEVTKDDCIALSLSGDNHGIIEYVNTADYSNGEGLKGDVFITDNGTDYGLRIPYKDITDALSKSSNPFVAKDTDGNDIFTKTGEKIYTYTWSAKDTFTGTIVGNFNTGNSGYPDFSIGTGSGMYSNIVVDLTAEEDVPTVTVEGGVNTLAKNNTGDLSTASYADYLCTIVKVEGVIARGSTEYYLLTDDATLMTDENNRIYLDNSQGVVTDEELDKYLVTKGTFVGLLGKRNNSESMLIIIDANFMTNITELIFDENKFAPDLAQFVTDQKDLSDVTVKIHRTGIKPLADGLWNTICLPITVTVDELKAAITSETKTLTSVDLATFTGKITEEGLMEYTVEENATEIMAGTPYLVKFNGEIAVGTDISDKDSYYFTFDHKNLNGRTGPATVSGKYKSKEENDTHFVGLYGVELTYNYGVDNEKWQYISTTDNTLKYINGSLEQSNGVLTKNYMKGLRAVYCFDWWYDEKNSTDELSKMVTFTSGTTGINGVKTVEGNAGGKVYNLNGQCVGTSLEGLAKGIYIVDGKKYIRK